MGVDNLNEIPTTMRRLVMNIYLFISGVLLVLLSFAHAIFGEINVFRVVMDSNLSELIKTSVYVPWHQISFVLLFSGVANIYISFKTKLYQISSFILIVVIGNLLTFLFISTMRLDWEVLRQSLFQIAVFALLIVLILVGISSIKKNAN